MKLLTNKRTVTLMMLFFLSLFWTGRISAQPNPMWTSTYNGTNNGNDRAFKSVVDANGNIYTLGTFYNGQTKYDIILNKYNSTGTLQWNRTYYGDVDADDIPVDIALDGQSNIYIAINNYNTSSFERIVVKKYSSTGNLLWTYTSQGNVEYINNVDRNAYCMDVKPDGTIHIGGIWNATVNPYTFYGFILTKVNSSGSQIDSAISILGVDTLRTKIINDLTTDNSGNIYIAGSNNNNLFVKKFNSNLDSVWTRTYNGAGNGYDEATKIFIDANFYLYVGGTILSANAGKDMALIKYDNGGTQQWISTYNGPGNGNDEFSDMAVNSDGSVYITGKAATVAQGYDISTSRINSSGTLLWTNHYNGSSNNHDWGTSIALDNAGALYVGGTSTEGANGTDYIVLKYSTLFANQHWAAKYSLSTLDTLTSMILDANNNVIVSGHHKRFLNNDRDWGVYKLGSTIGIQNIGNEIPERFVLGQNYPNPFNPTTNINLSIPKSGNVKIVVFDITGKEITTLVDEQLNAGTYKIDFNALNLSSGVYFYKLITNEFTDVKKMNLVK